MSKNKLPERLNWPDQSEFSSEDRNAVWNKIKRGEKKRSAKWLPYSLSAVAAAAAMFLVVQLTGVEEQAPVDQPEEVDKIEESIEENVKPVEEQNIDMREFEIGDVLNGWTVTDILLSENENGNSYVKFDKTIEMEGNITENPDLESWSLFEPDKFEDIEFPIDLEGSQLRMQRRLYFYEKYFEFEGKTKESVTLQFSGIYINFDTATGQHNTWAMLEVPIGPPYLQFDERSISEKSSFLGIEESFALAEKVKNKSISLTEITPTEIINILPKLDYDDQLLFFTNHEVLETYNLGRTGHSQMINGLSEEGEALEVMLSEDQAYIGILDSDQNVSEEFHFQKEKGVWKVISLPEWW
ncbi:hypothetical protein [Jeotgalibacillus salarius]|uniref:Uncharacterized protein n=1 Tax=Jeotgalibacillus salarius TaxID=546023 RepID=A0A4Y8LLS2_9BACL|nr:hypothetical protein [Jeotgalibacillus salarius]TFE02197.1 hypothetical protein E2626_06360 [Jeotgalibacillus salarius]